MKKLIFYVGKADIKGGTPGSPGFCPVAIALKRKLPKNTVVSVGRTDAAIMLPRRKHFAHYKINEAATAFIKKYDDINTRQDAKPIRVILTAKPKQEKS